MQSQRRKGLVYPIEKGIADHDDDVDAELFTIESHSVYRGIIDPRYTSHGLDVQWLYDDLLDRVGLMEYESTDREKYSVLWIHDNPYGTFLQEPDWTCRDKTVWAYMTNEAYQDCLEEDLLAKSLYSDTVRIILPSMLPRIPICFYHCTSCKKRTLSAPHSCKELKKGLFPRNVLFLDNSGVIYDPPQSSQIWSYFIGGRQHVSYDQPAPVQAQEQARHQDQGSQCPAPYPEVADDPPPPGSLSEEPPPPPQDHPQTHSSQSSEPEGTPAHT
jgi:hypothetical protein